MLVLLNGGGLFVVMRKINVWKNTAQEVLRRKDYIGSVEQEGKRASQQKRYGVNSYHI